MEFEIPQSTTTLELGLRGVVCFSSTGLEHEYLRTTFRGYRITTTRTIKDFLAEIRLAKNMGYRNELFPPKYFMSSLYEGVAASLQV